MWLPILDEPGEGYARRQRRDKKNRLMWVCQAGKCRVNTDDPPLHCACSPPKKDEPIAVCKHFGPQLGTVPCGCGNRDKLVAVHECKLFGPCMERTNNKPGTRWQGLKIAVCLGCDKRETT